MTAVGLALVGFGILTAWSAFNRVLVFNVLRALIGAPGVPEPKAG